MRGPVSYSSSSHHFSSINLPSTRYPLPTLQGTGNVLVTPLGLLVSMGGDDHLLSDDPQARMLLENAIKKKPDSKTSELTTKPPLPRSRITNAKLLGAYKKMRVYSQLFRDSPLSPSRTWRIGKVTRVPSSETCFQKLHLSQSVPIHKSDTSDCLKLLHRIYTQSGVVSGGVSARVRYRRAPAPADNWLRGLLFLESIPTRTATRLPRNVIYVSLRISELNERLQLER
ncbi:hypothetical protein EVAR_7139_1 [Eumeta japonica]|uniref:Uncharacterized protein n=1 Tax=Eumeta variegata TaxID=151549 RepID=A0A4C1U7V2_EUMVA|nr:hypothetical protein EVAR_7139_1 [Eumeta japonica]